MVDPLEPWRALPAKEREAIEALLQKRFGKDIEIFAAKREGDEVAVHAIYYSWDVEPQQVGADIVRHSVRAVTTMGGRVTDARYSSVAIDERDHFDAVPAIAALKERSLAAIFGPELSPEEDAMLAAIDAAPDDDGPRSIYADWLQERGDPRGEFIALQRSGKPGIHLAHTQLKGIPWCEGESTVFDRGFVRILGLSYWYNFVAEVDCYARMRPLPEQFVSSGMVAAITRDRRRFVVAHAMLSKPKKRNASGAWDITVGRCADRSTIFSTTLPWAWDQKGLTNEINRVELVDGDVIKLWFASGERAKRISMK